VLGLAAALVVLTIVQLLLPSLRTQLPWMAALHVLNGIALAVVAITIARAARQTEEASDGPEAVLAPVETS
jgi:hypothetical protein